MMVDFLQMLFGCLFATTMTYNTNYHQHHGPHPCCLPNNHKPNVMMIITSPQGRSSSFVAAAWRTTAKTSNLTKQDMVKVCECVNRNIFKFHWRPSIHPSIFCIFHVHPSTPQHAFNISHPLPLCFAIIRMF